MIIECSYCEARVDAKIIAQNIDRYDPEFDPGKFRVVLLECPTCQNSLVAGQVEEGGEWDAPTRLWPSPEKYLSYDIPEIVRTSLEEAKLCFKARAYAACAVMCGRSLEGISRHHSTKSQYLAGGLKELQERGIIDGRLFEWAEELKKSRNIGAHATGEKVSKQDARDLLDFTNAICEYIFVLTEQFQKFMERRTAQLDKKLTAASIKRSFDVS
ncbi:MAG: DUF4145 domain-containing protein [Nitrospira sp.]|nr:DUF4145 domain-containing protein [Nitrospira sp.]